MTANLLPLRLTVRPDMTVSDIIGQTARQIRELLERQQFQLTDLRRDLGRLVDSGAMWGPAVNFMRFDYDLSFAGSRSTAFNLSYGPIEDLSIAIYDRLDGDPLRIDFDANPALYDAVEIADHHRRFLRLLEAVTANPDQAVGTLICWPRRSAARSCTRGTTPRVRCRPPPCRNCSPRRRRARPTRSRWCSRSRA